MLNTLIFVALGFIISVPVTIWILRQRAKEETTGVPKMEKIPEPPVKRYQNTVEDRNEYVQEQLELDISPKRLENMTFEELKKEVQDKGELTTVVRVRAYNAMLGLMAINVKEDKAKWIEPLEEGETTMEFHRVFCRNTEEQNRQRFKLINNYWKVTLVPAMRGDTDMGSSFGPNHDGLGITKIEQVFKELL